MRWPMLMRRWSGTWLSPGLALALSACAYAPPVDLSPVDHVLADKGLRENLVERGTADTHFVHEILHELGRGSDGDQRFARLFAEHLGHHPTTARAVFQELAAHREFQDWVIRRLRGQKDTE